MSEGETLNKIQNRIELHIACHLLNGANFYYTWNSKNI